MRSYTLTGQNKFPSYKTFRESNCEIFSSTHLDSFFSTQPGTSHSLVNNKNCEVPLSHQEIKQKYQEKEGEVTILRSQLKETKLSFVHEQKNLQSEWKKKFLITEKQIQSIKSELEFKVSK